MARGPKVFANRAEAGRLLGAALQKKSYPDPVVLALPRGGVAIGLEVARMLAAPLDVILVRKIGVPTQPELAAGAIVDGASPEIVYNDDVLALTGLTRETVDELGKQQLAEIERRRALYLAGRQPVAVAGKTAIVVDDGVATGATAKASLNALKRRDAAKVVLAVPVGPSETLAALGREADEVIALAEPRPFHAIGLHYLEFHQLGDDDVIDMLKQAEGGDAGR